MWILTVNSGDVSSLTAVVAASTAADAAAEHRGEDDLNAVQVGGEVGPCWQYSVVVLSIAGRPLCSAVPTPVIGEAIGVGESVGGDGPRG